jgi:hypothetical protein
MVLPKLLESSERMDNDVFGSKGETYKHRFLMRELLSVSSMKATCQNVVIPMGLNALDCRLVLALSI